MTYEEFIQTILTYYQDSKLYPFNSHWWIHIPNHAMDNNKHILEYLPKSFNYDEAVSSGLLEYFSKHYNQICNDDQYNPVEYLNVGLLNGYTEEYIIFGSVITLLTDGKLYQFNRG